MTGHFSPLFPFKHQEIREIITRMSLYHSTKTYLEEDSRMNLYMSSKPNSIILAMVISILLCTYMSMRRYKICRMTPRH